MSALRAAVGVGALLGLAACGGDATPAGTAKLALRVHWQGHPGAAAAPCTWAAPTPGFGPDGVPATVRRVRILVDVPRAAYSCCVAVDPHAPALARRQVVLTGLPAGAANVSIAGFATDEVPEEGATSTCLLSNPAGAGEPCAPIDCGTAIDPSCGPSACRWQVYEQAGPTSVTLKKGQQASSKMVSLCAEALVAATEPPCGGVATTNPVPIGLRVVGPPAIARAIVDGLAMSRLVAGQVDLNPAPHVCPTDGSFAPISPRPGDACICKDPGGADLACGDGAALPCCVPLACSSGEDVPQGVSGIVFAGLVYGLDLGCARALLAQPVDGAPHAAQPAPPDFAFDFLVGAAPPTPTASPTGTATITPTLTATSTATSTFRSTATASATPTATASATPVDTFGGPF